MAAAKKKRRAKSKSRKSKKHHAAHKSAAKKKRHGKKRAAARRTKRHHPRRNPAKKGHKKGHRKGGKKKGHKKGHSSRKHKHGAKKGGAKRAGKRSGKKHSKKRDMRGRGYGHLGGKPHAYSGGSRSRASRGLGPSGDMAFYDKPFSPVAPSVTPLRNPSGKKRRKGKKGKQHHAPKGLAAKVSKLQKTVSKHTRQIGYLDQGMKKVSRELKTVHEIRARFGLPKPR